LAKRPSGALKSPPRLRALAAIALRSLLSYFSSPLAGRARRAMAATITFTVQAKARQRDGDEFVSPFAQMRAVREKKTREEKRAASEALARKITMCCINCMLGEKIPTRVKRLWATAGVSCTGLMTKRQLMNVLKGEFPKASSHAMKKVPSLFEAAASGKPPKHGLTLESFNKLFCVFLFHAFDDNQNEVLEIDEVKQALEYLSGEARVPIERAIELVRSSAAASEPVEEAGEATGDAMDLTAFRQLYVTMLGGAALY